MLAFIIHIKPSTSASFVLQIATSKQVYSASELLKINGNLSNNGVPVPDALVLLQINYPDQSVWVVRTLTTGQSPTEAFPVEVLNVTTTDLNGRPKDLFGRGEDIGIKVAIQNNAGSSYPVCVMVNLFFSTGFPFCLFTLYNATLEAGKTAIPSASPIATIPPDAPAGQATAHVSIFSGLPDAAGIAYAPEKTAAFRVVTSETGYSPSETQAGTIYFTMPLLSLTPALGNYQVFARTHNGPMIASDQITFELKLAGDITPPFGVVDMKDVANVSKSFGLRLGDTLWNPVPDINKDDRVDMRDISIVAKEFGLRSSS